ncbi:MAG TPA: type III-A CRISPR-associated RAMP protein Csm3 [Candidatus Eremiobacteraeota bacterium]|nr:type III-A CRISPR-associated RAMP protein Csm3 [Candidatus Eremiobacteraeota bacterium]
MRTIEFIGKIIITGDIETRSGLYIGGMSSWLEIAGLDKLVIRNSITNLPYIPGSSLRGKLRSLIEKELGKEQNKVIKKPDVYIHECQDESSYSTCEVCQIFGISHKIDPEGKFSYPSRLIVRDVPLDPYKKKKGKSKSLKELNTDFPYTELKWEATIDRITSSAVPRQFERVPAEVIFSPFEFIFNLFTPQDMGLLWNFFQGLILLEHDYLGGMGSRGYGKIKFTNIEIRVKSRKYQDILEVLERKSEEDTETNIETLTSLEQLKSLEGKFKTKPYKTGIKSILEKWIFK